MEGDVDGVMARPSAASSSGILTSEEVQRERDKWDAWNSQKGLTRTDAKKRYIEALIDTMHRYATTPYVSRASSPTHTAFSTSSQIQN